MNLHRQDRDRKRYETTRPSDQPGSLAKAKGQTDRQTWIIGYLVRHTGGGRMDNGQWAPDRTKIYWQPHAIPAEREMVLPVPGIWPPRLGLQGEGEMRALRGRA